MSDAGRAALKAWRALVGSENDGLRDEWRAMSEEERLFWLQASRLPRRWSVVADYGEIPGDVRATLKNNLYRAARRARVILGVAG